MIAFFIYARRVIFCGVLLICVTSDLHLGGWRTGEEDIGPYLWRPVKNILKIHISLVRYGTEDLQGFEWISPLHRFRESCP
jgi:hypothetical protein